MHPNFLIIGPPKCASTSLYYYLQQHPEIYLSKVKETGFFTHDYYKGTRFYEKYFADAGCAKAIGEATPSYSFLPFAADRIKKLYPDIKLIICFRNPMERAFSNWLMLKDAGVEKAGFREALEINLKQLKYVEFESEAGAQIWNDRRNNIDIGEKWVRVYIQPGMYSQILNTYFERFNKGQVKYIFIEDLKNDFKETMNELFTFLCVNSNFTVPLAEEQNFYYNRKVYRGLSKLIGVQNTRLINKFLPDNLKNLFKEKKEKVKTLPKMSFDDRQYLWDIYKNDILDLEKLTNRNLSHWCPDFCSSK